MGMSCGVSSNFINRINASFSSELTTPTAIPFFSVFTSLKEYGPQA